MKKLLLFLGLLIGFTNITMQAMEEINHKRSPSEEKQAKLSSRKKRKIDQDDSKGQEVEAKIPSLQKKLIEVVKKKNASVAEFIKKHKTPTENNKSNKEGLDNFYENICLRYRTIEKDLNYIFPEYHDALIREILNNFYNTALIFYNSYSYTSVYLSALKRCGNIISEACKKKFTKSPAEVFPGLLWIDTLAKKTYGYVLKQLQITQKMSVRIKCFKEKYNNTDTLESLQALLLANYKNINNFTGMHQKTALSHYYEIAEALFKQNSIPLAHQTIDDALSKEWDAYFSSEISALKELRNSMIATEVKLIEALCENMIKDMKMHKTVSIVKNTLLHCHQGFIQFLNRLEDLEQKRNYRGMIYNLYYELATDFIVQGSIQDALQVIDAGSEIYKTVIENCDGLEDFQLVDFFNDEPVDLPHTFLEAKK